jgi:transcriptional regulator with XRE-family HTH domain
MHFGVGSRLSNGGAGTGHLNDMVATEMIDAGEDWEQQIEKSLQAAGLGDRIRRLRRKRSMGLMELGRLTGLSASFLSQLETGRVIPTLRNLSLIALVFQKDLFYFFEESRQSRFRISRGSTRTRLALKKGPGSMISESMSVLIPDRSVVPCIAEFSVAEADASFLPEVFDGEEFVYVLDGSVIFTTASNENRIEAGDVLWADGNAAREYRCEAGRAAKLMIITCPSDNGRRQLPKRS